MVQMVQAICFMSTVACSESVFLWACSSLCFCELVVTLYLHRAQMGASAPSETQWLIVAVLQLVFECTWIVRLQLWGSALSAAGATSLLWYYWPTWALHWPLLSTRSCSSIVGSNCRLALLTQAVGHKSLVKAAIKETIYLIFSGTSYPLTLPLKYPKCHHPLKCSCCTRSLVT